jgi:tyrosyl-tRNA synthetase
MPSITITEKEIGIVDLLVTAGVVSSKRQAREDIKNKAIYINDQCSTDLERTLAPNDRLHQKYTIIRRGKKNYFLIKWLP